jgi:hypothetical protein
VFSVTDTARCALVTLVAQRATETITSVQMRSAINVAPTATNVLGITQSQCPFVLNAFQDTSLILNRSFVLFVIPLEITRTRTLRNV